MLLQSMAEGRQRSELPQAAQTACGTIPRRDSLRMAKEQTAGAAATAPQGLRRREAMSATQQERGFSSDCPEPKKQPPLPIPPYPYTLTSCLGKGTYGAVYKATDPAGNSVALKTISLENEMQGVPSTALREISTMQEINHTNVLKLLNVFPAPKSLTMAFELADFDLQRYLDMYRYPLSSRRTKSFMYQLLCGLAHIHNLMILHRDIKPQNLLLFANGTIKLADFGLSRAFSVPVREFAHEVVTLWYRPPDVLLGNQNYDTGVDIWSLGCVFAEMLECRPLFAGSNVVEQLRKIFQVLGTPTEDDIPNCTSFVDWKLMEELPVYPKTNLAALVPHADPDAFDLLSRMLVYDGKARIGAEEALSHPYFKRTPFPNYVQLAREHVEEGRRHQRAIVNGTSRARGMLAPRGSERPDATAAAPHHPQTSASDMGPCR